MVSYADMITIVLAFFVVLYATTSGSGKNDKGHAANDSKTESKVDNPGPGDKKTAITVEKQDEQLKNVFRSLCDRFGPNWTLANCWIGGPTAIRGQVPAELKAQIGDKKAKSLGRGQPNSNHSVNLVTVKPGDYIVPGGRVYFDEFSDELSDEEKTNLHGVADELSGKSQKIEIRGHTSRHPLPKDSPFNDHFDLAYARCRAVSEYLSLHGVEPGRIRLAVSAENEPAYTSDEPDFRKKNSRVEIRLLNEWLSDKD